MTSVAEKYFAVNALDLGSDVCRWRRYRIPFISRDTSETPFMRIDHDYCVEAKSGDRCDKKFCLYLIARQYLFSENVFLKLVWNASQYWSLLILHFPGWDQRNDCSVSWLQLYLYNLLLLCPMTKLMLNQVVLQPESWLTRITRPPIFFKTCVEKQWHWWYIYYDEVSVCNEKSSFPLGSLL